MGTMVRNQFEDLFMKMLPNIDHIINEKYGAYPEEFSRYFNMNTSTRAFENVTEVVGLDYLTQKNESTPIDFDSMLPGFNSQYVHVTYALGARTSFEAIQDDLFGIFRRNAQALGTSARYTPELVSADIFNKGFSGGGGASGPDGVDLFSTAHPLIGGGTASNVGAAADLGVTSLQNMLNSFAAQVNDRNQKIMIQPRQLIVPQAGSWMAEQLLGSAGLPGSADNDINSLRMAGLSWSTWHYLTDSNAYFIMSDVGDTELQFFWRMQYATDHDIDFQTGDGLSKIVGRFSVGWSGWRGLFGSQGPS